MKRVLAILIAAGAMTVGLTAGGASADVHGVSQAGCGKSENAGAIQSRRAIDVKNGHGRPAALIPVTASKGRTQGKGGSAPAQGQNCGD
jgi:hypothetical protein